MRVAKIVAVTCAVAAAHSEIEGQTLIDKYLVDVLSYTTAGTSANGVAKPRDLDFKPYTNELWVLNYGNSGGGTSVIFYNAGESNQTSQYRKDSHSGHFMMYPSAIAFSDIGEWGCTSEIKSTAGPASTFMGPALWSGDTAIYARVFQNNWAVGYPLGSHTDMLHQSPFAMGIAHEKGKTYWVADGWNGNICKYDFVTDHGPGYDDHSPGKIWRYTDVPILRAVNIPGHMVMDTVSKWLYVVDAGNKKVFRVNTNTGSVTGNLTAPNEILASYKAVTGATQQTIDTFTSQPCGLEYYQDRLLVSDYQTGEIRIYNTAASTPTLMGIINTGQTGIMGLKVGFDGKIWFVNHNANTLVRIDPSPALNDASIQQITTPFVADYETSFHSPNFNYCDNNLTPNVVLKNNGSANLTSAIIDYSIDGGSITSYTWSGNLVPGAASNVTLGAVVVGGGEHKLSVSVRSPNGLSDGNRANDAKRGSFRAKGTLASLPFVQDFSLNQYPPFDWSYMGFNKFAKLSRNTILGSYGTNDGCLMMNNMGGNVDISGQTDYFMSPLIDLTTTEAGTRLLFDVAYAQYSSVSNDRLDVKISSDCGVTWQKVYDRAGSSLSTAPPKNNIFLPQAFEWRTDTVSLDPYIGNEVLFLFTFTSNYGNNIFVDNINIYPVSTVGLDVQSSARMTLYPNPAEDLLMIKWSGTLNQITVRNLLGQDISSSVTITKTEIGANLQTAGLPAGTYFVTIQTDRGTATKQFLVHR